MDAITKEKLAINVENSWKMASNWVMGGAGIAFAIYLQLPFEQQQALLQHLPVPAWLLPIVASVVGIAARLMPQKSITPSVAAAKSADAPQPLDSSGFPVATGPAPLPTLEAHREQP